MHIGTQGWNYDSWIGPFYPEGTKPVDFLRVYARAFNTVEVDSTFYAIPAASTVRDWASRSSSGNVAGFMTASSRSSPSITWRWR